MNSLIFRSSVRAAVDYGIKSTSRPLNLARYCVSSDRPSVFITRRVPRVGEKLLEDKFNVTQWKSDEVIPREELLKSVKGVDALFCLLTDKIDDEVLDAAGSNLKVIGTMSVGFDHLDLSAIKSRKIRIGYTPNVLTDATAELTVALLLMTSRRLKEGVAAVKNGEWGTWAPMWLCGPGLHKSTVGVVGFGRIGAAVAQRLQPFGVKSLLYHDQCETDFAKEMGATLVPMDELLERSDFVVTTCALTDSTRNLMNSSSFKKMKNTCIFVNTSRGGVVNQEDLYDALKNGDIGGAGLDVTTPEPLPMNHPLLELDNCVVLPHIASATHEARGMMSELTARNIIAGLAGGKMPAEV